MHIILCIFNIEQHFKFILIYGHIRHHLQLLYVCRNWEVLATDIPAPDVPSWQRCGVAMEPRGWWRDCVALWWGSGALRWSLRHPGSRSPHLARLRHDSAVHCRTGLGKGTVNCNQLWETYFSVHFLLWRSFTRSRPRYIKVQYIVFMVEFSIEFHTIFVSYKLPFYVLHSWMLEEWIQLTRQREA